MTKTITLDDFKRAIEGRQVGLSNPGEPLPISHAEAIALAEGCDLDIAWYVCGEDDDVLVMEPNATGRFGKRGLIRP